MTTGASIRKALKDQLYRDKEGWIVRIAEERFDYRECWWWACEEDRKPQRAINDIAMKKAKNLAQ